MSTIQTPGHLSILIRPLQVPDLSGGNLSFLVLGVKGFQVFAELAVGVFVFKAEIDNSF